MHEEREFIPILFHASWSLLDFTFLDLAGVMSNFSEGNALEVELCSDNQRREMNDRIVITVSGHVGDKLGTFLSTVSPLRSYRTGETVEPRARLLL